MEARDIFERDKLGEEISHQDPEYHKIREMIDEAQKLLFELNNKYHEEPEVRRLFSQLTGIEVEKTFRLRPPFYTDFGKNIRVGKNVFINHCCTFMDRGGITLEDGVLIGPKVNLITINHPLEPHRRHSTISSPILIKKNVVIWLTKRKRLFLLFQQKKKLMVLILKMEKFILMMNISWKFLNFHFLVSII